VAENGSIDSFLKHNKIIKLCHHLVIKLIHHNPG